MLQNNHKFQKGQTLIEVLIAAAVVVMISVSLISASLISVKDSKFSQNQAVATDLSQKMIEEVRVERDKRITDDDWAGFNNLASDVGTCYGYSGSPPNQIFNLTSPVPLCTSAAVSVSVGNVDFFPLTKIQRINTDQGAYAVCVYSTVRFDDSTGARYSKKKTILTNWSQGNLTYTLSPTPVADIDRCNNSDFSF